MSLVLADACALLAYLADEFAPMTPAGLAAMEGEVAVSPVTVWEITRKVAAGKLPPLPVAHGQFTGWLAVKGFQPLPLTWPDAERANALPPLHKDPMDRMLIAQALNNALTVVTQDRLYSDYGVSTIW